MIHDKNSKRYRQITLMGGGPMELSEQPAPKKIMSAQQMQAAPSLTRRRRSPRSEGEDEGEEAL